MLRNLLFYFIHLDEVEVKVDQHDVIFKSSVGIINIDVNVSELKDSLYVSSDQLNQANGVFCTLCCILQNGQSIIIRERIKNSHQMTLRDFF